MLYHFRQNRIYLQTFQPQDSLLTTPPSRALYLTAARDSPSLRVVDGGAQVVVQLHRGRRCVEPVGGRRERDPI